MYSQEPEPTPGDLNWRMFGVRVRVHPFFWLTAAFLGWDRVTTRGEGVPYLLLWIGCVFVSILLHEFGHIVAGRAFGADGRILLYAFGGLAIGSSDLRSRWQRVVVYLAGPFVQLALSVLLFLIASKLQFSVRGAMSQRMMFAGLWMLISINGFWALFNLLPIYPLDGGQVTREVCDGIFGSRGVLFALGTSMVVSGGIAVLILLSTMGILPETSLSSPFNALLFALFAANNLQLLQLERARRHWDDDRLPWER